MTCKVSLSGTDLLRQFLLLHRLVRLVVKASASGVEDPGFEWDFSGSSHTRDLKMGIPVATLPGAWHHRVSAETRRPGVSILRLGEVESWICNLYLSVAARKLVRADPSLTYTSMLLGRKAISLPPSPPPLPLPPPLSLSLLSKVNRIKA